MEAAKLSAKRGKKLVDFVYVNLCVAVVVVESMCAKLVDFVHVNLCVAVVVVAKESDRNYVMFACGVFRVVSTQTTCRFSKTSCSLYENIRKCITALRS
jgi:hypothetical protein